MKKPSDFLRHTTVLFFLLAVGLSTVLFSVKYQVHDLEEQHKRLVRELDDEQRALHVLRAEWATLNDPKRIEKLASTYLGMKPAAPSTVVGPDAVLQIPMRDMVFDGQGDDAKSGAKTGGKTGTKIGEAKP